MTDAQKGFPWAKPAIADAKGQLTLPWYYFFLQLWYRTGGQDGGATIVPTGFSMVQCGPEAQEGWLECNGAAVNRNQYNALFFAIGTLYGAGDGLSTFNLPDFRDRFPVGRSGTKALAATGGSETAVLAGVNNGPHSHDVNDPMHSHGFTGAPHSHANDVPDFVNSAAGTEYVHTGGNKGGTNVDTADAIATGTNAAAPTGITIVDSGLGTPFAILNPWIGEIWVIKT